MKLSLRLLLVLATSHEAMTYKELGKKTGFHINTVSRYISCLYEKGLIEIKQKKSDSLRGKKWVNVVRLRQELKEEGVVKFFSKVSNQLDCQLNDVLVN